MAQSILTQIKRCLSTAETYEEKGKRCWAYAKNGKGDFYYGAARDAFERSKRARDKAEALKAELD